MKCRTFRAATTYVSRLCVDCGELPSEHEVAPYNSAEVAVPALDEIRQACSCNAHEAAWFKLGFKTALAATPPAPSEPARQEKSRSKQLLEAGFTPRDTRTECDECGKKFSRLLLPIHGCDPAQPVPAGWVMLGPDGSRFQADTPFKAASAAQKHRVRVDPVAAKQFHDTIEELRKEGEAENARLEQMFGSLNCPACGGSGHVGDTAAALSTHPQPAQASTQVPVAEVINKGPMRQTEYSIKWLTHPKNLGAGTKLYASPVTTGEPAGAQAGEWRSHPASIDTDWYVSSDGKVLAEVGSINLGGGAPYYAVVGTKRLNHRYVARANAQRDVEAALTTMAAIPEAKEKP